MNNNDYLTLCKQAQNKKLKLSRKQEQQIKQIYNDMYKKLSKKIKNAEPDSLTERYLEELQRQLAKEIKEVHVKVGKTIKLNTNKSSKLASDVQLDFFISINNKYDLGMEDAFVSMFSKLPKEAMNEILFGKVYKDRKGLDKRIWEYTKKFEKDIDYIIAEGIANKKSTYEIAKDLEIYVNPYESKPWAWKRVYPNVNKMVDYNAQRLARTAINHAYQQAQKRSCKKNPFVNGIKWISANNHRTCELCNSRNGIVYSIDNLPLDHPNGLCTTVPVIEKDFDQIGEELRDWVNGEENPKLDEWYKKYGEEFSGLKNDKGNSYDVSKEKKYDIINSINKHNVSNESSMQSRLDYIKDSNESFIPKDTIITNVKTIAGKGSSVELRSKQSLSEMFGGNPDDWEKKVGKIESKKYIFDIHWNELDGKHYLIKIKNRKEK